MSDTRIITILPETVSSYKARTPIDDRIDHVVLFTDAAPGMRGSVIHYDACDSSEQPIEGAEVPHAFLMEACEQAEDKGAIPGTLIDANWVY